MENKEKLNKILGKITNILGVNNLDDYKKELNKLSKEKLYLHGAQEYNFMPRSYGYDIEDFKRRCHTAFIRKMGGGTTQDGNIKIPKTGKKAKMIKAKIAAAKEILERLK